MSAPLRLYAWIGVDEFGSGHIGLKQAFTPAGFIPLVAIDRKKIDHPHLRAQLQQQATQYGVTIRLAAFDLIDDALAVLTPL